MKMNKKGAIELSMSTIVILVLAMSMLILGLVLVKSIFTGAKYNVDQMNDKVKDEIGKLFTEEKKAVVYLPNMKASIKQGEEWGVGYAIQNNEKTQKFNIKVEVSDSKIKTKCGIADRDANNWITTGGEESKLEIQTGEKYYGIVRFNIPKGEVSDISTCIVRFRLTVQREDRSAYTVESFDVQISK
jgi:hypothetical protein